jgi:predicted permease
VIQTVLPAVLFRAMMRTPKFTLDGVVMIGAYFVFFTLALLGALLCFGRRELAVRPALITACLGMNVGLFFYPIMIQIAGEPGISLLAMMDIPGGLSCFLLFPALYSWTRKRLDQKTATEDAPPATVVVTKGDNELQLVCQDEKLLEPASTLQQQQ